MGSEGRPLVLGGLVSGSSVQQHSAGRRGDKPCHHQVPEPHASDAKLLAWNLCFVHSLNADVHQQQLALL